MAKYLHEIQTSAAGASPDQFSRLVEACLTYGRRLDPTYPATQAMIDASMTLEILELAGLRITEAP